jgi:hypothetical protein
MITTINFNELFPPDDFQNGVEFVDELLKKREENGKQINKRIKDLTTEFYNLVKELEETRIILSKENTNENFQTLTKINEILKKIEINRDLRKKLYDLRNLNT